MVDTAKGDVTELLCAWSDGDGEALERLMPLVYDRLQRLAASFVRHERDSHTLQATALVHEAYVRLIDQRRVRWQDRAHFFAISARLMRRILVDHARRRSYAKRGGGLDNVPMDEARDAAAPFEPSLVALDDALRALQARFPEQANIVELRYFGGLDREEIAEVLGLSTATVTRRWRMARAWLYRELHHDLPNVD